MLIKAPAKINLTLRVLSKRADGYHEISSLMRAIRLFDEVEIALVGGVGETPGSLDLRVRTDMPGVPEGPGNLAYRAAELMLGMHPGHYNHINISIKKNIPMAAGLAGGSADAAAVLLGLSGELAPGAGLADIASWGAELGMDIPFCVYACAAANPALGYTGVGAMLAGGAGELLTPADAQGKAYVVLVKPQLEVSTKQIYELHDIRKGSAYVSDNDLEAPCAEAWPTVAGLLRAMKMICAEEGADGVKVQLSGSGPTVFAYFPCEPFDGGYEAMVGAARKVCERARLAFPGMFVRLTETI